MKKTITFTIITILACFLFALIGCDSGNGIIPGNGNNGNGHPPVELKTTVLVETYIATGCSGCAKVEPTLENLAREYTRDEMILVELVPFSSGGPYYLREAGQRYTFYGLKGGVPQILFNGLNDNILGVAGYAAIKSRIEAQRAVPPVIQLQAMRSSDYSGTVINGKVKNISGNPLINLVINGMVIKDMGQTGFHYTVTNIFEDEKVVISSLAPGEEKDFTMAIVGLNWDAKKMDGVIFVQSMGDLNKFVRQSFFLD